MKEGKNKKNTPVLRDTEDKRLYQKIYRENTVKFRVSKEEAALLEGMMVEEDYVNLSEFIRSKIFGNNPERELKKRIQKKSRWDIIAAIKQNLLFLNSNYRYIKQVMPKDIEIAIANQNARQIIELDRKWLTKLQESTEEVNKNLQAIMYALGISTETPIGSNDEAWDSPDDLKKARLIWELNNDQQK